MRRALLSVAAIIATLAEGALAASAFRVQPTARGRYVFYLADQDTDGVLELYRADSG